MKRKTVISNVLLQALRIEELIGLVLITLTLLFASFSNLYTIMNELPEAPNFGANLLRILASGFFTFWFLRSIIYQTENRGFQIIRDFAPFLFVLVIFYNLQDAIFIIHPHDIHQTLVDLDGKLFGVQPTVWSEQYYHPRLTDWFAFTYLNYYVMTPILLALLYLKKENQNFRVVILTMMISYFIGFISYVIFPASSPYLVIPELYQIDIWKDTSFISWITYTIVDLSPHRVRDAFPSMHNTIVLLTMMMAWRFHRKFFWIQLPLAISMPFATIYLRYHYVVDIIAALPVIAIALYLSPRLEYKWKTFQQTNHSFKNSPSESGLNI